MGPPSTPTAARKPREDQEAAYLLAAIVESSQDAIIAWSLDGVLTSWNPGAERLLGYTRDEALGMPVPVTWAPGETPAFGDVATRLAAGESVPTYDGTRMHRDGTIVEVTVTLSPVKDSEGTVIGVSSILRDISETKRAERLLAEEQSRWAGAFRAAPIGMSLVDLDGGWLAVNRALCRLLGRSEEELLATDFQSLTHPDDLGSDLLELRRTIDHEIDGYELEKRYLRPDGDVVWAILSVSLVRAADDRPLYFVSQLQDITSRKQAEAELLRYSEQLTELARHDPVTGLRNYREFHSMVDGEIERARRHGERWSLVLFDVNGFEAISRRDRSEGDQVLYQVGNAIAQACRASDLAARIGADEFALILPVTSKPEAEAAAERIAAEVARTGHGSVSFGIATWPVDGQSKELILTRADMSLRTAKRGDRARLGASPQAPPLDSGRPTDAIHEIVSVARQYLGMDVAYLAEISAPTSDLVASTQHFSAICGDASSFGIEEGATLELDGTYCKRMLAGTVANAVPAVAEEPELARLAVTSEADIGSYIGVPVKLSNGHVYGTLCAVSHQPTQGLEDAQVDGMVCFARLVASHIENDAHQATSRRSEAELAGVHALLSALLARDHYTGEHSQTVVSLAKQVARRVGLGEEQVRDVEQVALLHDIGKVGIPDAVLQKQGPLSEHEWELMRQHPAIGARILAGTRTLAHLAPAVNAEHERFDGHGYPDGLKGEAIPLASRITLACDAYHAMTSDRPYRAALDYETAVGELRRGAGSQFDPDIVDALLQALGAVESGAPPEAASEPSDRRDVLSARTPRQTPVWEPVSPSGSPGALGEVRAVCQRCGAHVPAVVTRSSLGGNCGNCGSYELKLVDIGGPQQLPAPTSDWRRS